MASLAVFQNALDDIDRLIIKLRGDQYKLRIHRLGGKSPHRLPPSLLSFHLSLAAFFLNNKMRKPIIDCDLFFH